MNLVGTIRRIVRLSGGNNPLGMDEFGNLTVSPVLPKYARLAAAGRLFSLDMTAGTAKAPVVAAPTTSPEWGLFNASPTDCLCLLQVGCALQSGTAGLGLSIMVASAIGPQTQVTAHYTAAVASCLDGSQRQPEAYLTNNPTLIGGAPSWSILEQTKVNSVAVNAVGSGLTSWPDGMFIARPNGGMVCVELVGETGASALFDVSAIIAMIDLDRY